LDPVRRPRHHVALETPAPTVPARAADDLPGPVRVAEPAQACGADPGGPVPDPRRARTGGDAAAGAAAARDRRPLSGSREPVSARVLGRPAPAHRRRPRARAEPEAD